MKEKIVVLAAIIAWVMVWACSPMQKDVVVKVQAFEKLSEYGFFEGKLSEMKPSDRVLPYDLSNPLFSDYAHKARFVWMPEGVAATYTSEGLLEFPKDAVLIKSFYYQHDERDIAKGRRIIETRLLINNGEQWEARSYIWNDQQTDATYDLVGDIKSVAWIDSEGVDRSVDYIIPNKNQCKGCHYYDHKQMPIGPKAGNLNKEFAYEDGTKNQLLKWAEIGYLNHLAEMNEVPMWAAWDDPESGDLHRRAMAYLDINCRHCHNPNGPANTTGLTLTAHASPDSHIGIYKSSVAAGAGTGGHDYNIVPGHADESILYYRMASTEPASMMPELGRRTVHVQGLALIKDWIDDMAPMN